MTAATTHPGTAIRPTTVGFGNLLISEWTKLRSVRSTYWTTVVSALATVAIAGLVCGRYVHDFDHMRPAERQSDLTNFGLTGVFLAQIAFGTLGVLAISSEYGTGMIRATLTAVPQRRTVLAAKAAVLAAATIAIGEIIGFAAFGLGQAILSSKHTGVSLGDPGAFRATMGAGLYPAATAMLGFGLGALIRHTAGALSALFGLLYAGTAVIDLLPTDWRNRLINYMPVNAGSQVLAVRHTPGALGAWTGFGGFLCYAAAAVIGALLLINRRDA
ncbi:ABC transporter permease [Catenulispora rubra]|uniref:ABC transporter permease n=1 Tax=Catenulispora rubra TaxID=280293 RepID=UPI0018927E93|nr:ABC transporter permease [Catenulispora rubra]